MSCEPEKILPARAVSQSKSPGLAAISIRALWIVLGSSVLIVVLFVLLGGTRLSETGRKFVTSFVYSACIAVPSVFLITWVSFRWSARYPRLMIPVRVLALLCTTTAGCLAADALLEIGGIMPIGGYWSEMRSTFPFAIVISLVFGLSISSYETMRYKLQSATLELRNRQVEQERAYKLLAEARLSSLESRIHPHFLFNTLNSIAALIPTDPRRAEDTVAKLASLLRFSLNAQHNGLVPLAQELKVVRDYLEIESTRFGPRLRYEILAPGALESIRVPPLALQTLVENSVKHVAAQRAEGTSIQIAGAMESGRVRLEVIDDGPGFSLGAIAPEHGLGNLAARLELLFGSGARLDVTRENEKTVVRISFPAEQ